VAEPAAPSACPVAALAREARACAEAYAAADERLVALRAGSERRRLERGAEALRDRLQAVEGRAASLPAASAEGALFQLALADGEATALRSCADDRHAAEAEAHLRRVERLLWSVRRALERLAGVRGEEVFGDWHMGRELDPHAALEAALAEDSPAPG
jgi:hypothetical protein